MIPPTDNPTPLLKEDHISQVPALQVLQHLGYTYLTPEEAEVFRGGRKSNVLLEGILAEQLRKINDIHFKGETYEFSEGNIQSAIQDLKNPLFEGLIRTNEKMYDLLTLGRSLSQTINGDMKSFQFNYIDWANWENNSFHVTEEFSVERAGRSDTRRPDLVLFVNGIPFAVIECKRHVDPSGKAEKDPLDEAVSQQIRNQKEDEIPRLFVYTQLLLAISKNDTKYATIGTPSKFWSWWREDFDAETLQKLVNVPLSSQQKDKLFGGRFRYVRDHFDALENVGREPTYQDQNLYALCRPQRLLELALRFTVFDAGERKVARYQQFFTVRTILERINRLNNDGKRTGGVVWHTQGSGKSLTMVMLAEAIAMAEFDSSKVILVTDRVDLDDQLYKTFQHCGGEPVQAKTGKHLITLLEGDKSRIITTVIDKFEAAVAARGVCNINPNIFVLVDESHRTQYGSLNANMSRALPNACFIGFTGTPVMKKNKNTVEKFGGMIAPAYTIQDAVKDQAVVPLLYEGRHVDQDVDQKAIDAWFDRITENLTKEQSADLKKKFSAHAQINKVLERIRVISWDIGKHFVDNWQGTPFKAQLVAPDKATALRYKQFLDEFGQVTSEVLISGPDDRLGEDDIHGENNEAEIRFWKTMMTKYGTEKEYNRQIINAFKHSEEPEIIIVVNKLTTGFDAPRNTVLYLCKPMQGHDLLQTIARVNRLHSGKDYGYIIDYCGVLKKLDEALDLYGSLAEFEAADVAGAITDVAEEVKQLPQHHSDLWDVFKTVSNKRDEEAYEKYLADETERVKFYERLRDYGRSLGIALSTVQFIENNSGEKIQKYKQDLKFFMTLRAAVRRRYAEVVDFKDYESKIKKLLDAHVGAIDVTVLTPLVNIFDANAFAEEIDKIGSTSSKADTIAYRTKATILAKMDEDPAFYKKFSTLLENAIALFKAERITDIEYLGQVQAIRESVLTHTDNEIPETIKNSESQRAFYGIARDAIESTGFESDSIRDFSLQMAVGVDKILKERCIVNWKQNLDVQNRIRNDIEDLLFELLTPTGKELSFDAIDKLIDQVLGVAGKKSSI